MSVSGYLIEKHGGKTVTFTTIAVVMALGWGGMEIGWVPTPASQQFVLEVVADNTKGLNYLVESALKEDLDFLKKQQCNGLAVGGPLGRTEQEFRDLLGRSYVHRQCTDLNADLTV